MKKETTTITRKGSFYHREAETRTEKQGDKNINKGKQDESTVKGCENMTAGKTNEVGHYNKNGGKKRGKPMVNINKEKE
eukprot:7615653-Ditylum_brightwellii.AAC.1